jgi:hypothetical protein
MSWTVEILDSNVEKDLGSLPLGMLASFARIVLLVEAWLGECD